MRSPHQTEVLVTLFVTVFNALALIVNTIITAQCGKCVRHFLAERAERHAGWHGYDEPPFGTFPDDDS